MEVKLRIVYILWQSLKKSFIINNWGIIKRVAGINGKRVRGEKEKVERKS